MFQEKDVSVEAVDLATSFDLAAWRVKLESRGKILGRNPLILQLGEEKYLVLFEYGSAVFFNFTDEEKKSRIDELKNGSSGVNRVDFREKVVFLYGKPAKDNQSDQEKFSIGELTLESVKLVAIVLSRSVSLEYYEDLIEKNLTKLEQPIGRLASRGRFTIWPKRYIKQFGAMLTVNLELAHNLHVLEEPDLVWDLPEMERLYKRLNEYFALADRAQSIEHKLKIVKESCEFIIGMQRYSADAIMELAIIVLFVIDIILLLFPFKH